MCVIIFRLPGSEIYNEDGIIVVSNFTYIRMGSVNSLRFILIESRSGRNTVRACLGLRLPLFPQFPVSWQRDARPCITFPQAPLRTAHQYHDYRKIDINDYELKSCIFFKIADLWRKKRICFFIY